MKFFNSRTLLAGALSLSMIVSMISCKKDADETSPELTEEEATVFAEESMEAEASYDDLQDLSMTAADEEGITSAGRTEDAARLFPFIRLRLRIGQCADITVSPSDNTYPKTVTIDFGNGCPGLDGRLRKGKIILHFTGPIRQPGSILTITTDNYFHGRAKIEGTKTITNMSTGGSIKFSVAITDGKVSFPNGRGYAFTSAKVITQVAGGLTTDMDDDIYEIEGRSETSFNNGAVIKLNIVDPLVKKLSCHWISEGTLAVAVNNRSFQLDYGFPNSGSCDNKALLEWNAGLNQKVIVLP